MPAAEGFWVSIAGEFCNRFESYKNGLIHGNTITTEVGEALLVMVQCTAAAAAVALY